MTSKEQTSFRVVAAVVVTLIVALLAACSAAAPTPSQSPAASPKPSSPAPSSAPPSASPSSKTASPEEQAFQKSQESFKQVIAAAQKETQPAVMNSIMELDTLNRFEGAFNKIDPKIQIKMMHFSGSVTIEKLRAEAATKQYTINLYQGGSSATRTMAREGLSQLVDDLPVLVEPGTKWAINPLLDKPRETLTYTSGKYFVIYNTQLVPAGQEPKSWKDLGKPIFKDKLVLWDPRVPSLTRTALATLYLSPEHGPDLVKKIIDNARFVSDVADASRAVARGEFAASIVTWEDWLIAKDGPVKVVVPEDGVIAPVTQIAVAKTAPQPNTTKVFLNWLLGKEGQALVGLTGSPVRADVEPSATELSLAGVKFMPNSPPTYDFEQNTLGPTAETVGKLAEGKQ